MDELLVFHSVVKDPIDIQVMHISNVHILNKKIFFFQLSFRIFLYSFYVLGVYYTFFNTSQHLSYIKNQKELKVINFIIYKGISFVGGQI